MNRKPHLSQRIGATFDRLAERARRQPVGGDGGRSELAMAGHVFAASWLGRNAPHPWRRAAAAMAVTAGVRQAFGRGGMAGQHGAFYPLTFLPDLHGPHFHTALRRLLVPALGPFVVHFALTGACPWQCQYCFSSAGGSGAPDQGDQALEQIAAQLASRRVPIVILGGGEPLVRFERALRHVEILATGSEVRLATSGSGFTVERARQLQHAGLRVLAISLDSDNRAAVDAQRGPGAFATATRAIAASAQAGIFTLVTSVVARDAFASERDVDRFLRHVHTLHPGAVVNFIPAFATGRGADQGFRTPGEYAQMGERLTRAVRDGGHRAGVFYATPIDRLVGCVGSAHRQVFVDIRGNLCACVSSASFGNLLTEPFDQVWQRLLDAPSRFKQGYFCSHVAERVAGDAVLGHAATLDALADFFAQTPDAGLQRLIDVAGPALAWLVPEA